MHCQTWTEVSAWIYFFSRHTGVSISDGIGQRTVFLEQCWGREAETLLKAHPHTNVRYSNEQSGPSEYYSSPQYRHPTMCDIVQVYQIFVHVSRFQLNKGVNNGNIWKGSGWCEWRALLPPVFHSLNSSWHTSVKRRQKLEIKSPGPAGKNHTLSMILTHAEVVWIHLSSLTVETRPSSNWFSFPQFEISVNSAWVTWLSAVLRSWCCQSVLTWNPIPLIHVKTQFRLLWLDQKSIAAAVI